MDTAKLPRSRTEVPVAPVHNGPDGGHRVAAPHLATVVPGASGAPTAVGEATEPAAAAGRPALQEERRQLRRQQRRYAAAGIAVLAAVFVLAVIVLGGVR
jgi:hypothetical protein